VNVALIQLSRQTRGRHEVVVVVEDGKSVMRSGRTYLQIDGRQRTAHAMLGRLVL
jgi:hypothetical protein